MRVLIIPSWYPTPERPVNGIFVREQAEALNREHEVRVLFVDVLPRGEKRQPRKRLSKQRGFVEQVIEVSNRPLLWQFNYLWTLVRAFRGLREEFRPDVVHCHVAVPAGLGGVLLKRLFGVPAVLTEHSSEYTGWLKRPGLRLMARIGIGAANLVICVSEGQKERLRDNFHRKGPIEIVPNMVDTTTFTPSPMPSTGQGFRLLFVGLMDTPQKGVPYLLEALAKIKSENGPGIHLDLAGDGALRPEYEALAARLGLAANVTFHALQPKANIARMLRESHALVLPSLHEATPLAIIESLASGRPVISTRCGGPEYMIDETNGLIVEPGQANPLAAAITGLLARLDSYEPRVIAENAIRKYSPQAVIGHLTVLYERLLRETGRARKGG